MLGTLAVLEGLALVFDRMQAKHRIMVEALRGRWTADAADALLRRSTGRPAGSERAETLNGSPSVRLAGRGPALP